MTRFWWRWLARNRLLQFLVLGGALFAQAPRPHPNRSGNLSSSREQLDALHGAQARRLGRATLTDEEARAVDERAIQDEVPVHSAHATIRWWRSASPSTTAR